ncbi:MAG: SH3-like domain-containing protein [Pseudomonadota bacterium]
MTETSSHVQETSFEPGARVRVSDRASLGHCRTPFYLRGRAGIVIGIAGRFKDPERLAYHKPGLPVRTLYRVRFAQKDLWPGYDDRANDDIEADIFDHWLEPEEARQTEQNA